MLPSFKSIGLPVGEKKWKIDFQDAAKAAILDLRSERLYLCLIYPVIPMLPTKFRVNWIFDSGEETKNIWSMAAILDHNDFSYFWSTAPRWFLPSFKSIGLSVQEKKRKMNFRHGGHLWFPIGTILAIFDLPVTPILPTKPRVDWPFGSGEKSKNTLSRLPPWWPSWISDRIDFSYFWSISHPILPTKVLVNWHFGSGEEAKKKKKKQIFKMG